MGTDNECARREKVNAGDGGESQDRRKERTVPPPYWILPAHATTPEHTAVASPTGPQSAHNGEGNQPGNHRRCHSFLREKRNRSVRPPIPIPPAALPLKLRRRLLSHVSCDLNFGENTQDTGQKPGLAEVPAAAASRERRHYLCGQRARLECYRQSACPGPTIPGRIGPGIPVRSIPMQTVIRASQPVASCRAGPSPAQYPDSVA